ncbi:coproporphyrinogen III oxidase [Escherichia coli]|uniref:Coproporphyrinogen III oxidase n=1 Tax=Escherichia coli TaxID=562 RepID=A0A376MNQ2_ECOLX|nr:coproporphyrinogen III oxidase [Escherichia coli]
MSVQQIDWDLALIQKYNYSGHDTPRTRPRWSFQKTSANRRFYKPWRAILSVHYLSTYISRSA